MQEIREINDLNNKFLALYGNIYEEREHLPPKQKELMQDRLIAEYKEELELLLMRAAIDRAREKYRLQLEIAAYTPRTWRVLWIFKRKYNQAAMKIMDEVQTEVREYFERLKLPANPAPAPQEAGGTSEPPKDRSDGGTAETASP